MKLAPVLLTLLVWTSRLCAAPGGEIQVGSKKFTESVILAEMACLLIRDAGGRAKHHEAMGGTQVLWQALLAGEIDLYPDYTGTLIKDVVKDNRNLEAVLAVKGVRLSRSLGFINTYALGMKGEQARRLGITSISDLSRHPTLRYGFSEEFRKRDDGWLPLKRHYGLNVAEDRVKVLDHDLAYRGLTNGDLDVIDVYSTEGEILDLDVLVLRDDRQFFPAYDAVWVYRDDLPQSVVALLKSLEGKIRAEDMQAMNLRARKKADAQKGDPPTPTAKRIAADSLGVTLAKSVVVEEETSWDQFWRLTREHLLLVSISLGAAVLVAVPLGVFAAKWPKLGQVLLAGTGLLQTIPSMALLVFFIPVLGIGPKPAVVAMFLYSLLPIVRNTHAGLQGIAPALRESAAALGLPPGAILWRIELPLASRSILAGIKTAAVINIGTAVIGALIGAGGYGQPILSGIRLGDNGLILQGAIPAACLALLVQGLFEIAERTLTPRGLRL